MNFLNIEIHPGDLSEAIDKIGEGDAHEASGDKIRWDTKVNTECGKHESGQEPFESSGKRGDSITDKSAWTLKLILDVKP